MAGKDSSGGWSCFERPERLKSRKLPPSAPEPSESLLLLPSVDIFPPIVVAMDMVGLVQYAQWKDVIEDGMTALDSSPLQSVLMMIYPLRTTLLLSIKDEEKKQETHRSSERAITTVANGGEKSITPSKDCE